MPLKDLWRAIIHFPVGALCAILTFFLPSLGISLTIYFIVYEVLNDWRKKDSSYKDVFGGALGYGAASLVILYYLLRGL